MIRRRMLFLWMAGSSRFRYSRRRRIRKSTSAWGRRQFSSENAYKREAWEFQAGAGFDDFAGGFYSGAVAGYAGEMAALGPAAVAVHDYGQVLG